MRRVGAAALALLLGSAAAASPDTSGGTVPEDDLLQITLTRLAGEAAEFGPFRPCPADLGGTCDAALNVAMSVVVLDDGRRAEVNGDVWQISASTAKAFWMAAAVHDRGPEVAEPYAGPIFVESDDLAAAGVIDLVGPRPGGGVDRINQLTRSWGMADTFLRGWYGDIESSEQPFPWGYRNVTTTDELALFWAGIGEGDILTAEGLDAFLGWASLPRPQGAELITPRLPAATSAWHKVGWLDDSTWNPSYRRLDGALIQTPSGIRYAIGIAFQGDAEHVYTDRGIRFARYASCEVFNAVEGTGRECTEPGDPASILGHTSAPRGAISSASAERDRLRVAGWALDRDLGPGPVEVRITVDGDPVGTLTAGLAKPWIHHRYGLGGHHGFGGEFDVGLDPGEHQVCAVGINDSGMGPDAAWCTGVTVSENHPPRGRLHRADVEQGIVIAGGSAWDPDTGGPIKVKVVVDGVRVRRDTADGGPGGHRFSIRHRMVLDPGEHRVCVVALDHEAEGADREIGCRTVTVPGNWPPAGNLADADGGPGGVFVKGRAHDPDGPGPVGVTVTVDGTAAGVLTAEGGGGGRRYAGTVAAALDPGIHRVCAMAADTADPGLTTVLGCRDLAVPENWAPRGTLAAASADGTGVWAKGRAWDPDTTDPIEVRIEVDGSPAGTLLAAGGSTGCRYAGTVDRALAPGEHEVCAVALDAAGGPGTLLGCRMVAVTG